jgi:hypothetical protein
MAFNSTEDQSSLRFKWHLVSRESPEDELG